MEGSTSIEMAGQIFGGNFIGPLELNKIADRLNIHQITVTPTIPFDSEFLKKNCDKYLLIYTIAEKSDGSFMNLKSLKDTFGDNPSLSEPCFYNQDWYINEDFYIKPLVSRWNLIRKEPFEDSKGEHPDDSVHLSNFPDANLAAFTFFSYWLLNNLCLWPYNYVWCNNKDQNDDRIYVGRYYDINSKNKNGFSIHRHLSLRDYHCAISVY